MGVVAVAASGAFDDFGGGGSLGAGVGHACGEADLDGLTPCSSFP